MSKRPCNLSIDVRVLQFAEEIMALRGQSNLTQFVEELIRDEYERRRGPLLLGEAPAPYQVNSSTPATSAAAEAASRLLAAAAASLAQSHGAGEPSAPALPPAKAGRGHRGGRS